MNKLKEQLKAGNPVVGTWLNSGSQIVAELMAMSGFDFVCVDAEHSAVDLPQTQQIFQAISAGSQNCSAMVRLHGVDYSFVKQYLDAGARGVIAPLVRTKAEAELLVEATKYPPLGLRGVGFCRANNYGMRLSEEFKKANDDILVAVQIEHIEAVENIDEILSVEGIDAAFIGPYDLSASMEITGQFDNVQYVKARDKILEACKRHQIISGIHVVAPEPNELIERYREGYRLLAYSLDITMLTTLCQSGLKAIREGFSS
jgi:2-dehydro-3-deoxyglucarate aldolase